MTSPSDKEKKVTNEKPISLAGVDFKKLLSAFLKVEPDQEEKVTTDKKKDAETTKEELNG